MKSLNSFINFRSSRPNLQSSNISLDRLLTVGSPSGLNAKWMLKLVAVFAILLTVGVGNVWGAVTALTIPYSWGNSEGKSAYTDALGCTQNGIPSDHSSAPKVKFDGTGDYLQIQIASAPAYVQFNIKGTGTGTWSGTFKVQESDDNKTYVDAAEYTSLSSSSTPRP